MEKMTARCGLICTECEGFIATQNNDSKKLEEIAQKWSKHAKKSIPAESLFCDGCLSASGRLSGYCQVCGIRKCANAKGLSTCAVCPEYGCDTLLGFISHAPKAKENLEAIRRAGEQ